MAYLTVEGVTKSFRKERVLDGLTLEAEKGQTMVVFGPSGAGKTVLLRLIAGIYQPDGGEIRIDGRSVLGAGPESRDIGMAFQNFALYPHLSAFENIASPLRAHRRGEAEVKRKVEEVAGLLRITHVLGHMPRELSNGQKQRTALARSLVRAPSVLLLDDPLRNVDAKLRYEMRLELPRVLRAFDATVLYVTQDYKEAMALGQQVGVLLDGNFRQVGTPAAVYKGPAEVRIARLFGDPTINLYPVQPRQGSNGLELELFGSTVRLPGRFPAVTGQPCLLGLRPEDVRVQHEPGEDAVPVELDAVTPLNVRTVLFLRARDRSEILATAGEEAGAAFGRGHRQVWARFDLAKALLFDQASGQRLALAA